MKLYEFRSEIENNTLQRNTIIEEKDFVNFIDPLIDCYRSLFYFTNEIKEHVEKNRTVAGFKGKVGIDKLVWDFDNLDIEKAREDALNFIKHLAIDYTIQENEIGIYFSGRKGFAIEINTEGLNNFNLIDEKIPLYTKKSCISLAEKFASFDRVIYNTTRLYRLKNTRHQKSSKLGGIEARLFKVQLGYEQISNLTAEQIKQFATKPRLSWNILSVKSPEKLNTLFSEIWNNLSSYKISNTSAVSSMQLDGKCPAEYKYCIWAIEQGKYTDNRDTALLILAAHNKKQGIPREVIQAKLFAVRDLMHRNNLEKAKYDPITDANLDRIINQAFANDYSHGCNNALMSSICSDKCYLYRAKKNASKAGTISLLDAYNESSNFYKHYYENLIKTGFPSIDESMPMFLGTTNLLVGQKGVGKTSLVLNIIKNMTKLEIPTIFFNLDMSEPLCIAKLGSILLADIAGKPVLSAKEFMEKHVIQEFNGDFKKALEKLSKWVAICSKRNLSIEDIQKEIETYEQLTNISPKLIIVDHIQLLRSKHKNEYERHTYNSEQLTALAKTKNLCVLGLSHSVVGLDGRLLAKGSRSWEQDAHSQINCKRIFQHNLPEKDKYLTLQLEKNRFGITDSIDFFYDGASALVRELTEEEKLELQGLKEEVEK